MSGFFKKFIRKKPTSELSSDSDANRSHDNQGADDSWTEHEISHEITPSESKPKTKADTDSEPDLTSLGLNKLEIAAIPSADIENAIDFDIDPMDDITAQIQAEIAEEKRVKAKQEQRRLIIEATDQFRRPEWSEDVLKPEE